MQVSPQRQLTFAEFLRGGGAAQPSQAPSPGQQQPFGGNPIPDWMPPLVPSAPSPNPPSVQDYFSPIPPSQMPQGPHQGGPYDEFMRSFQNWRNR